MNSGQAIKRHQWFLHWDMHRSLAFFIGTEKHIGHASLLESGMYRRHTFPKKCLHLQTFLKQTKLVSGPKLGLFVFTLGIHMTESLSPLAVHTRS